MVSSSGAIRSYGTIHRIRDYDLTIMPAIMNTRVLFMVCGRAAFHASVRTASDKGFVFIITRSVYKFSTSLSLSGLNRNSRF